MTHPFRAGDELPGGIEAFQTARSAEVVYWLPQHRAVVAGDVLLGAGAKPRPTDEPLRLCPERWLGKMTHDDLRETLRPLLDLPVEQRARLTRDPRHRRRQARACRRPRLSHGRGSARAAAYS